ncbi:hypothetical protein ACOMHN_053832 [Nucella lapillus]
MSTLFDLRPLPPALQHQAFTARKISHLSLPDIEPLRKYSSASLFSLKGSGSTSKAAAAAAAAGAAGAAEGPRRLNKTAVAPFTTVPPTGKPKSRWRGMARQLLWNTKAAQMRLPEELPRSEIRIYVSCTQDLSEEREFLDEVAYPELRKFCEKQGLSCHVVDLRHGTNRLKNDRETFDVIQREITKCQKLSIGPCFVSVVGEEADDRELPGWLSHQDMLNVRGLLVKGHRVEAVEVLDNLYRLDSNYQPPIYLLEDSYFFAETQETAALQEALPEVLDQLRHEGKLPDEPNFFSWSSLVKEIETGLLSCLDPKRQALCLLSRAGSSEEPDIRDNRRKLSVLSDVKVPEEYKARTGNEGADKLRSAIVDRYNRMGSKDNLILFNASHKKSVAYLREMCTLFLSAVTRLIERQIAHHEFDITHHMTGAADAVQHVTISRQACSSYVGGESVLSRVSELMGSIPGVLKPIVVGGPEGSGKTALTSLIASALPRIDPLRKIVFRSVGLTLSSSSLFHLLNSVYCQVAFIYDMDPSLPDDLTLHGALQAFRDMLHDIRDKLTHKGPLTIVLDGVEKIPGISSKHLSFLIASLPQGVTLVLSMLDIGPLFDTVKSVAGVEVVTCPVFTSERSATYVKAYLTKRDRVVTNDQLRAIVNELSGENAPLVAKISASMASRWPSHTLNDELDFSEDMESAFHRLVESCEHQLGYRFTRYVLSLLVASRYGLAEFEILHIISTDTNLIDEIKEEIEDDMSVLDGYPYQLQLSRLLIRLEPFLYEAKTEGEAILKISHDMLRYVVEVRFMADSFKHHIHTKLATFFQFTRRGHLLSSRDIVEGKHRDLTRYLWRTLRSVPHHLCHSHPEPEEAWKRLKSEVFMKFSWVINEIYAGLFNDFVDDMNYALETLGLESDILYFRQFLNGVREAVIFNPVSLASLMAGQDMTEMQEIHKSVQEAEEWLKQVHLQVLVPSSYTTPKTSQLQLKETLAKKVKSLAAIPTEERMILQYDTSISSLEHRTGEETTLVALAQPIVSLHLWGEAMMTVVTTSPTGRFSLDTYAVEKGRHIKTTKLQDTPVSWLHVRPDGAAFYSSGCAVKKLLLEKGQVSELFTTKEQIIDACMSNQRVFKVVVLHTSPDAHLTVYDSRHPGTAQTISLLGTKISERCKPLDMTKDNQFVVVACDRRLLVVNLSAERLAHSLDFNNVPVSLTSFSRSHEHVFVVTPTGVLRCFKLDTGLKVMDTLIRNKQKPQQLTVLTGGRNPTSPRSRTPVRPPPRKDAQTQEEEEEELITSLVTSEDDHFLLAGSSQGRVYTVHVPTGGIVCVISSGQAGVKEMVYFTNMSWFQSLATVDVTGWVKLWRLTPLLLRARTAIKDVIADEDLLREEEAKMDLALYCQHFQEHRNDRVFLNGPDVSSFYRPHVPEDLFLPVQGLDPALQTPLSWMTTSRLGDCTRVTALSTGTDLSEVLVTVTKEGDVARWSLQDGSLQSLQPCPCPLGKEEKEEEEEKGKKEKEEKAEGEGESWVESVRMVYYDQAIFVVVRRSDNSKRTTVAVQYSEDKKIRPLILNDVIASYVSTSNSLIVHVISGEHGELVLVFWDLVKGQEEDRVILSPDKTLTKRASSLVFSNDLSSCALLIPNGKDDYTLNIWTLKTGTGEEAELDASEDKDETVFPVVDPEADADQASRKSSSSTKETREFQLRQLPLQIKPTAVAFGLNNVILLGTSRGVTLIVAMEKLSLTSAMTAQGVEASADQPLSIVGAWTRLSPAHCGDVKGVRYVTESYVVTTVCSRVFCVWNLLQKKLLVRVPLEGGDEFTHHVLSRDCRVLTFATSGGVLAVWGVQERKQLCAFKSHTPVSSLAMTPDNRRVAVLLDDEVTSRVQVFDVRNIDDIRVHSGSQSDERRESMTSRRTSVADGELTD